MYTRVKENFAFVTTFASKHMFKQNNKVNICYLK